MVGSYFSNAVISEVTMDFMFLPILDAVTHVISWMYSIVDVVDKCFDSMPRGPAGSNHGDFAEVELTINNNNLVSSNSNQSIGAKIQNSLKLVEMYAINNSGVHTKDQADGKVNQTTRGEDYVCAVCLGDIKEEEKVYELPQCNHIFHSACLDRWVSHNHYTCPLCRTPLITDSSCSIAGGAIIMQDEEGLLDEGHGFFLGFSFIPRCTMNINFDNQGWTQSMMRLAGF